MSTLNRVFLMGNLTRDPEVRYTPSGTAVGDLGLAVNETYKNKAGETVESTVFVDVEVWARQAETCNTNADGHMHRLTTVSKSCFLFDPLPHPFRNDLSSLDYGVGKQQDELFATVAGRDTFLEAIGFEKAVIYLLTSVNRGRFMTNT